MIRTTLTGRTEGGKIVNFKAPACYIGQFVKVKITDIRTWSLLGELVE